MQIRKIAEKINFCGERVKSPDDVK